MFRTIGEFIRIAKEVSVEKDLLLYQEISATEKFFRRLCFLIFGVALLAVTLASCDARQVDIIHVLPGETCQQATERGGYRLSRKDCLRTAQSHGRASLKFDRDEVIILHQATNGAHYWEFMEGQLKKKK